MVQKWTHVGRVEGAAAAAPHWRIGLALIRRWPPSRLPRGRPATETAFVVRENGLCADDSSLASVVSRFVGSTTTRAE